ncbi:MAG TPA: AMP-binding protein, partial [Anaerolineales bacterium]|nr:AMP-binding protein [Anaerolineales bacterium]
MLPTDRFPLITESGARLLLRLEEHVHAPRFTHPGVDHLTPRGLERARKFAEELQTPPAWKHGEAPDWLTQFVAHCYRDVPIYRRHGPPPRALSGGVAIVEGFFDIPTTDRSDLNREPWSFVPDSQSLGNLIIYNTSGTTGHPLSILTHPDTLAFYIPLLQAAVAAHGIRFDGGPDRVAIALVCYQKKTYTYVAVSAVLDQAGFVKINLNPDDWRDPADWGKFLDDLNPEIYTGDPISFTELMQLSLAARPKALVSTAMTLTGGLRESLEAHFGCPVIDVYSMNESGPIAVTPPHSHTPTLLHLLQPRLYVEILESDGRPALPGARGEITLTGGFNPFLPLLRYRTGDYAALEFREGRPVLIGLEGRPPVVFRAVDGRPINNVDVSNALRPFAIAQFNLHQFADGSLRLRLRGAAVEEDTIRDAVLSLFGKSQALTIEPMVTEEKSIQYTSDVTSPLPPAPPPLPNDVAPFGRGG